MDTKKITDFLLQGGFVTPEKLQALQEEAEKRHQSLEDALFEANLMSVEQFGQIVADVHSWNFVDLKKMVIDSSVLQLISEDFAKNQKVLLFERVPEGIKAAMINPSDVSLLHILQKTVNVPIIPFYAPKRSILENIHLYHKDIVSEFDALIAFHAKEIAFGDTKDGAVVKMLNLLLEHAYNSKASDIHVEPTEGMTAVRFRIDGVMHDIVSFPKSVHDFFITRIKILSKLRTDEHQAPQDGRFDFSFDEKGIDIRVSIVPTSKGENCVMRLLVDSSGQFTLEQLGLSEKDFQKLSVHIKKPWGMILVTGPTGSGKTTTLYAVLKILNTREVNIATIEDPVEYNIDGVTQIQVNPKANLTFSSGLRSIVRQDPNMIMVGEIRDEETANIAVNSAMTGHLVLSTLHTNDAATALPRFLEMNIQPFLISSTVNVIVAQRLVRRICQRCVQSYDADLTEMRDKLPVSILGKIFQGNEKVRLFKGAGCPLCHNSGYVGRIGVFEILQINDDIRKLIMQNANSDTLKEEAIKQGMTTMFDDAMNKVLHGVTTIEEMLRVVGDD